MTIQEYIPRLGELSRITAEAIVVPKVNGLLAEIRNRIQRDGKNTNEAPITPYSTKEGYFSKSQFDRKGSFKAQGKNAQYSTRTRKTASFNSEFGTSVTVKKETYQVLSKSNKKIGDRDRKTMYLPQGYKQLRDIQGKPTNISNQTYTGSTLASYQLQVVADGVLMGMVNMKASKIRKGQEAKKGMSIYAPSTGELADFQKEVATETEKVITGIFNA